ncbi:hypothetical protein D9M68_313750 [compost metagenome]
MRNAAVLRPLLAWSLALLASFSALAASQPAGPFEQMQVYASRATSSLLLYRGEGFQNDHLERMNSDLAALATTLRGTAEASDEVRQKHEVLVTELRRGAGFGHNEEDVPWGYTGELSKSLRDFLTAASKQGSSDPEQLVPVQVEYLAVQYLFRAYIGAFEVAKEDTEHYLGQDERKLVPVIDGELGQLDAANMAKINTRWQYLKVALSDLNSGTTAMVSSSGRPFAPTMVDRHARALTSQLMTN